LQHTIEGGYKLDISKKTCFEQARCLFHSNYWRSLLLKYTEELIMATITNANLILTELPGFPRKVEIKVTYNVNFSACERTLSPNLNFRETIKIVGVDLLPPIEQGLLDILPVQDITVPPSGSLTVSRTRTALALRNLLNEDPAPLDPADEIRCKINIAYVAASTPVASASADRQLLDI
jgi:hypothetical protein